MVRYFLFVFFSISIGAVQAQDKAKLDAFTKKYLTPDCEVQLSLNTYDFYSAPVKIKQPEALSEKRLQHLLDSFAIRPSKSLQMDIGLFYHRMNKRKEAKNHLDKAIWSYEDELRYTPQDTSLLNPLFYMYFSLNDVEKSMQYNQRILDVVPNDTTQMVMRFFLYMMNGDLDSGTEYTKQLMHLYPDLLEPYFLHTMGVAFKRINDIQTGAFQPYDADSNIVLNIDLSYLEPARKQSIDHSYMNVMVTVSEFFVCFYETLLSVLNETEEINKNTFQPTKTQLKRLDQFEQRFLAIQSDPEFNNPYVINYALGVIQFLRSKFKKAIPYFESAINNKPMASRNLTDNPATVYDNLVAVHLMLADTLTAEQWQQRKIEEKATFDPKASDYQLLALFKIQRGALKAAKKDLRKALEIDDESFDSYAYLAEIALLEGQMTEAEELVNELYALNPQNERLFKTMILFSLYAGDVDSASFLNGQLLENSPSDYFGTKIQARFLENE